MALLFLDSFDHYATGDMLLKWTSSSGPSLPDMVDGGGRCTTRGVHFSGFRNVKKNITPTANTRRGIVGFAAKFVNQGPNFFWLWEGPTANHFVVINNQVNASFDVYGGSAVGPNFAVPPIASAAPGIITSNIYYYVEIRWFVHPTAGEIEIRLNGAVVLNATGLNTRGGSFPALPTLTDNVVAFSLENRAGDWYCDDLYILDDQVTATDTINTTFRGDSKVECIFPDAAGAHTDFAVTGAATNHAANKDSADAIVGQPDRDTSYVASNTPGAIDTYNFNALTALAATIYGIQVLQCQEKTDAGARTAATVIRHAGVDYPQVAFSPSQGSYQYDRQVLGADPLGTQWTLANINALEAGPTVVS